LAGFQGAGLSCSHKAFAPLPNLENATHLAWATGGSMVPEQEMKDYYCKGKALL
jgi:D-serine dehydratase